MRSKTLTGEAGDDAAQGSAGREKGPHPHGERHHENGNEAGFIARIQERLWGGGRAGRREETMNRVLERRRLPPLAGGVLWDFPFWRLPSTSCEGRNRAAGTGKTVPSLPLPLAPREAAESEGPLPDWVESD